MYLDRPEALAVVRDMLSRCRRLLALSGPAWSEGDNRTLAHPVRRETDGSFIHNLDELVTASGGEVIGRRWEGARQVDGHTIYFVFARPRCRPA